MEQSLSTFEQKQSASNQMELLLSLYDGSIGYLNKAIDFGEKGDIQNRNLYANKAGDIICTLHNALDADSGGEIASNLSNLYVYMGRNLLDAMANNNLRGLKEVMRMLSIIKEGWEHAAKIVTDEDSAERPMAVHKVA